MKVNLEYMRITRMLANDREYWEFEMTADNNKFSSVILSPEEVQAAVVCMGGSSYYPYFDDLNHLIQFNPGGIKRIDLNTGKDPQSWITFPAKELIIPIEWLATHDLHELMAQRQETDKHAYRVEKAWETTPEIIKDWTYRWRPRFETEIAPDVRDALRKCYWIEGDGFCQNFRSSMQTLISISRNHGEGKYPSKLFITFDGWGDRESAFPSFYWVIDVPSRENPVKRLRVMNGGLLAHRYEQAATEQNGYRTQYVRYSIHT